MIKATTIAFFGTCLGLQVAKKHDRGEYDWDQIYSLKVNEADEHEMGCMARSLETVLEEIEGINPDDIVAETFIRGYTEDRKLGESLEDLEDQAKRQGYKESKIQDWELQMVGDANDCF